MMLDLESENSNNDTTNREMAEDLDWSERTVENALNDLDEAGLLYCGKCHTPKQQYLTGS